MKLNYRFLFVPIVAFFVLISCREFLRPIKVKGNLTDYYTGEPITDFQFTIESKGTSGLFSNPRSVYLEDIYTDCNGDFSAKFEEERGELYYLSYEVYHNLTYKIIDLNYERELDRGKNKFDLKAKREQSQIIEIINTSQVYQYLRFDLDFNTESWYSRLPATGRHNVRRVFPDEDNIIHIDLFRDTIEYYADTTIELIVNRPCGVFEDVLVEI
jgi:hypothetical protein